MFKSPARPGPSPPPTRIQVVEFADQRKWLFNEAAPGETWIEIDDQNVWELRDLE